jgi:hypothetical protein
MKTEAVGGFRRGVCVPARDELAPAAARLNVGLLFFNSFPVSWHRFS